MSDIDKILRDAIEGFEAPYNADVWNNISSQLSPMEDAFRNSVENYEAPYDPKAWSSIKGQIGSSSSLIQWIAGSAAAVGLVFGAVAFIGDDDNLTENVKRTEIVENSSSLAQQDKNNTYNFVPSHLNSEEQAIEENQEPTLIVENIPSEATPLSPEHNDGISQQDDLPFEITELTDNSDDNEGATTVSDIASPGDEPVIPSENDQPVFTAAFSMSSFEACQNETILFNPKVIQNGAVYLWDFGDGTTKTDPASAHEYRYAGDYNVRLTIKDRSTGDILATETNSVKINRIPDVNFTSISSDDVIPTMNFELGSDQTSQGIWQINGTPVSDRAAFEHTFREKGSYTVEYTATNEFGCKNTALETIQIDEDYNLFAPTAFSPDGTQYNTFMPGALLLLETEFTLSIHDETGTLIYQTNSVGMPWDGRDATNNSVAPYGNYVWIVRLKNGNGMTEVYQGQVVLIR